MRYPLEPAGPFPVPGNRTGCVLVQGFFGALSEIRLPGGLSDRIFYIGFPRGDFWSGHTDFPPLEKNGHAVTCRVGLEDIFQICAGFVRRASEKLR